MYDFTDFLDAHPGGDVALMQNAGGDATAGFYGPQHSDGVKDQLFEYHIGYVKEDEGAERASS